MDIFPHYMVSTNPRIRLDDGSVIWGYECWWQLELDVPLPEAQRSLEEHKDALRATLAALADDGEYPDEPV